MDSFYLDYADFKTNCEIGFLYRSQIGKAIFDSHSLTQSKIIDTLYVNDFIMIIKKDKFDFRNTLFHSFQIMTTRCTGWIFLS